MIPALIIVVPIRLLWELLSATGRLVRAYVLRPLGRLAYAVLVWSPVWLVRHPLWWMLRVLVLQPLRWVGTRLVVPLGRMILRYVLRPAWIALAWAAAILSIPVVYAGRWIGRGLVVLWGALWPLLVAFGRFLAWALHLAGVVLFYLLVWPPRLLWRGVVRPAWIALAWAAAILSIPVVYAGRWIGRGLVALWRALWPLLVAFGRFLVAFGRFLAWTWHLAGVVLFYLLIWPLQLLWRGVVKPVLGALRWAWRMTVNPVARWLRTHVWEPARAAGRSVTRALGLDARRP